MDRQQLSALSVQELSALFMTTPQQAGPALLDADLAGIERQLQGLMRPLMGRVVETVIATIAATVSAEPACPECGQRARLVEAKRERHLQGLVDDYTLQRPYLVCDACVRPVLLESADRHVEAAAEEKPMS